jgi:hypothetical protein
MIPGNANPLLLATAAADAAAVGPIKSLRLNSADSAHLSRTPSSAGNRRTWTWASWVKLPKVTSGQGSFFNAKTGSGNANTGIDYDSTATFRFIIWNGSGTDANLTTTQVFRDFSAWYHLVVAVDTTQATAANRVKMYINGSQVTDFSTEDYPSQNYQAAVNLAQEHYIGRNAGNGVAYLDTSFADIFFIDGSQLEPTSFGAYDDSGVWQAAEYDGTFGTNGFHLLDFANEATVGHDSSGNDNDFTANNIGTGGNGDYISELNNVNDFYGNGRATWGPTLFNGATGDKGPIPAAGTPMTYTPSSSITLTGTGLRIWVSRNKGGLFINGTSVSSTEQQWNSFGTTYSPLTSIEWRTTDGSNFSQLSAIEINGTQLIDNTAVGADNDILFDVPTNGTQSDTGAGGEVSGNYATLNPLAIGSDATLSNGNLDVSYGTGSTRGITTATIGMSSGKWYWEATFTASSATNTDGAVGITTTEFGGTNYPGHQSTSWGYLGNGNKYNNGSGSSYGDTFGAGDVIGIAFDADGGNLYFYKNGVAQNSGTAAYTSLTSGPYYAAVGDGSTGSTFSASFNFGQRAFAYSAPSGYKALCTTNLATPTIADGSDYFEAKLYTGNGGTNTISGLEFSPDWTWIKKRNSNSSHSIHDTVRGATKRIRSESTDAETTESTALTAFTSDGFTLGSGGTANGNNDSFVSWNWDAGSSTASNTDGNITANVRANSTAGFSIVTWTAAAPGTSTIGHGLSDVPAFVITKSRSTANHWAIFHKDLGQSKLLRFTTGTPLSVSNYWGSSSNWTSSTFCVAATTNADNNIGDMVAYCFAEVFGFSKFGTYEGTGSASTAAFVYTGMRPRWIMVKNVDTGDSSTDWFIYDTARSPFNAVDDQLYPNRNIAEAASSTHAFDILSNGFRVRSTSTSGLSNKSGDTYIYAAFSENAFSLNGGLAR